jgi:hypothetical protein
MTVFFTLKINIEHVGCGLVHLFLLHYFHQGIKVQLKAESAAHTDTHASLVAANQELDSLKRVKVQLDEYRSQSAESAIQVISFISSPLMFVLILLHITVIFYETLYHRRLV